MNQTKEATEKGYYNKNDGLLQHEENYCYSSIGTVVALEYIIAGVCNVKPFQKFCGRYITRTKSLCVESKSFKNFIPNAPGQLRQTCS